MRDNSGRVLFWMTLFAIAMAYLEATVVVYLRMLFYPDGFDFPLTQAPSAVILIELGREAATIIMLAAAALIAGRSKIEQFAYLIFTFGVWDIMYYVWLKVQIGWPDSLLTWDILFLIPTIWVGPVIAPLLVSLTMIWAALWVIRKQDAGITLKFSRWAWWLEIFAGLIIIISFVWDAKNVAAGGYPNAFRWEVFLIGLLLGINVFVREIRKPANRLQGNGA